MTEVKVAVLGASGWMGKTHTMAYQSFPHFFGKEGGTARVVALVEANPAAAKDLAFRAPGAKILGDWQQAVNDPDVDLIDICLPDNLHYDVGGTSRRQACLLRKTFGGHSRTGPRTGRYRA